MSEPSRAGPASGLEPSGDPVSNWTPTDFDHFVVRPTASVSVSETNSQAPPPAGLAPPLPATPRPHRPLLPDRLVVLLVYSRPSSKTSRRVESLNYLACVCVCVWEGLGQTHTQRSFLFSANQLRLLWKPAPAPDHVIASFTSISIALFPSFSPPFSARTLCSFHPAPFFLQRVEPPHLEAELP